MAIVHSATPSRLLVVVYVAASVLVISCHRKVSDDGAPPIDPASAGAPSIGYAPARWRLAPFADVNRTIVWVSHIVIMDRDSDPGEPSLRPRTWRPDPPMPQRTEAEALARAMTVADLAAKNPDAFDRLAKEYSDDIVTRETGGSLGGVRAGQLPPEYRDALAVLRPGETSRVFRTRLGYHVIKRRLPPKDEQIGGKRIVIRYEGTVGGPAGAPSDRSRAAALDLARQVAVQARHDVASFDTLVMNYSENLDAAQLGDMGVWSAKNPGFLPRQIERLTQLRVGEVSDPIETVFGFEILLRTPADPRPQYAMSAVQIQYDPAIAGDADHSRAAARKLATALTAQLRKDPTAFEELQKRYCCTELQSWTLGRGPVGVSKVLETLQFGEIAPTSVEANWSFLIARRVDPATVPDEPPPLYELPAPDSPNLDEIVRLSDGPHLSFYARNFASETNRLLPLSDAAIKTVTGELEQLADRFQNGPGDPASRVEDMHATLGRIKAGLGPHDFAVFDKFFKDWSTRLYLGRFRNPRTAGLRPRKLL